MNKARLLIVATTLILGAGIVALWQYREPAAHAHAHAAKYQCSMHPQIVRDEPGECPICHMQLQKVEGESAAEAAPAAQPSAKAERRIVKYQNPMNPKVFSDKPTKDPMGMDYIPVYADDLETDGDDGAPVANRAAFKLSEERRQIIGVRSQPAQRQAVMKTLRLPGQVGESRTQVLAQALEIDGGVIKPGLAAAILVREGESRRAIVVKVDRTLDSFSRTFAVLLNLQEEPDPRMRPGVYVDVRVQMKLADGVAVPKEAVLDTGDRQLLFVLKGNGRFEPRAIQAGAVGDSLIEVRKGVSEGEEVVTSANFLVDSESRFQAAVQAYLGGKP